MIERTISPDQLKEMLSKDTLEMVGVVHNCAQIALAVRSNGQMSISDLNLKGYVTGGDMAIERFFAAEMPKLFPESILISEEAERTLSSIKILKQSKVVILDDIDGSRVYANGEAFWSIILGLANNGVVTSGITMQPDLGIITISEKGVGTFYIDRNGQVHEPRLNRETDLAKVKIGVGAFNADPVTKTEAAPMFAEFHKKSAGIICMESTGYELTLLSRGLLSAYIHPGAKPWDKSAGMSHIIEQGGIATNFPGRHPIFESGLIVAANQEIYEQVLGIVEPFGNFTT